MKTLLLEKIDIIRRSLIATLLLVMISACSQETLDYNHPDVEIFVEQLKSGKLALQNQDEVGSIPKFTMSDIETLLKYADDMSVIPSFPLAPVSYSAGGKLRLGECILWTIETIRLGHNASMGCKWYIQMPRITKEFISFRMKKCWMQLSAIVSGGQLKSILVRCGL